VSAGFQTSQKEIQQQLEQEGEHIKQQQVELSKASAELEQLQNYLAQLAKQTEVQGMSDASHYKEEHAKLQAEVASLNPRVEQLNWTSKNRSTNIEELTINS
jgi:epidermal growth factor receptor substrate 15